jgi:hypothetical protein
MASILSRSGRRAVRLTGLIGALLIAAAAHPAT